MQKKDQSGDKTSKQKELSKSNSAESNEVADLEDVASGKRPISNDQQSVAVAKKRRVDRKVGDSEFTEGDLLKSWKIVLGNPPPRGETKVLNCLIWKSEQFEINNKTCKSLHSCPMRVKG